ncbi:MAG: HAD-IIIC family phosphatase [Xanthomonadales bacterium]|jgi:FkbH-like protein|nr:HAD-IIIC family phosphatase [Xanthomonadales bacterium]
MTARGTDNAPLDLVVAANFTAEPVDASLRFWLESLQIPIRIEHAPFDQVFQQLLNPASPLRANHRGIGIALIRLQDWLDADTPPDRVARELIDAFTAAQSGVAGDLILCFAPSTGLDAHRSDVLEQAERTVAEALQDRGGVRVLTSPELLERYPGADIADEHGERLAGMPYTPAGFCLLGTALARCIYGLVVPAHKVLVLDCDDTLWGGLCSELGPREVAITEEHLALQHFAADQRRQGRLVCLASRNNEADVLAVFDEHPRMALNRDDLTAWQIHWGLKSDSLAELADRLGLGLDSFVFLDDDPVQCAEVRRRHPGVLALQVPKRGVAEFCAHLWPLDPRPGTAESSRRTGAYREHVAREDVRASSLSFAQFLDSLALEVDIAPLEEADLARATELTHRTNQFNLTGLRLTEAELRNRVRDGATHGFRVRVRDRFGDYGLVGLILTETTGRELRAPVFLLSCRALGRGVEHRMMAHLGALARRSGAERVALSCTPTERNDPAREFLRSLGEPQVSESGVMSLVVDANQAEAVALNLDEAPQPQEVKRAEVTKADDTRWEPDDAHRRVEFLATVPGTLDRLEAIQQAVAGPGEGPGQPASSVSRKPTGESRAEGNPVEMTLARAFAEHLGTTEIGADDGFFELGGESLQAMQILAQVSREFDVELDTTLLFTTNFTVRELAEEIELLRTGP